MEFKARKLEVSQENPFKNDKLDRKKEVENISSLLEKLSTPFVLSINAEWGQGKTTFLEMLHANLKNNECQSIYFSAWKTDFVTDPLLTFIGEIEKGIKPFISNDEAKKEAWDLVRKSGLYIAKKGIPALTKLATYGALDIEKPMENVISKFTEEASIDLIEHYSETQSEIIEFKESIKKVLEVGEEKSRLYIFIDELDRCRPIYAIELLERIKHIMEIEGLIFVFAMDKLQLSHSINCIYGENFDSQRYLKRFIDLEYNLPRKSLDSFIDQLLESFEINNFFSERPQFERDEKKSFNKVFKYLVKTKIFSLRDIEQVLSKIKLALMSISKDEYSHPELLIFLVILKEIYPEKYHDYISSTYVSSDFMAVLYKMIPDNSNHLLSEECVAIEGALIAAKGNTESNLLKAQLRYHRKMIVEDNKDRKTYSEHVMNAVDFFSSLSNKVDIETIKLRIDMLDDFNF